MSKAIFTYMEENQDGAVQEDIAPRTETNAPPNGQLPHQPDPVQYWTPPPQPPVKTPSKTMTALIIIIMILAPISIVYLFNEASKGTSPDDTGIGVTIYDVSEIRGLEVLEEVPYRMMTDEELELAIEDMLDADDLNETGKVLYSLFLMESVEELGQVYGGVLAEQIMGYYDTEAREMVIIDTNFSATFDAITLSHELTHALQDQHFDLDTVMNGTWDEVSAVEALIEGDATKVMTEYMMGLPLGQQMGLLSDLESMDGGNASGMPYAIEQLLGFPYMQGLSFVQELHKAGGWDAVNSAYGQPPASTEQILHYGKYMAHETPLDVYPDISYSGMERTINETLGEFMVSTMLGHFIPGTEAEEAAAGWGGDNFQYWENGSTGDFVSVWTIGWDDRAECDEFYSTYLDWMADPDNPYSGEFDNGLASIIKEGNTTILYRSNLVGMVG